MKKALVKSELVLLKPRVQMWLLTDRDQLVVNCTRMDENISNGGV